MQCRAVIQCLTDMLCLRVAVVHIVVACTTYMAMAEAAHESKQDRCGAGCVISTGLSEF